MVSSERSSSDLSEYALFRNKILFFIYFLYFFLGEKFKNLMFYFAVFFFNYDDCFGKITSKSIRLYQVFFRKKILI